MRYELVAIADYTGKNCFGAKERPVLNELTKCRRGIKFGNQEFYGLVIESSDGATLTLRGRYYISTFVKRERKLTFNSLYDYCVENDYFTSGSAIQYDKMFSMLDRGFSTREIAAVICLCSSELTMDDVSKVEAELNERMV